MARSATNGADQTAAQIEAINSQLTELSKTVGALAGTQKDRIAAKAADLQDHAASEAERVQAHAAELGAKARDGAAHSYAAAEERVRKQPVMALGIAAGVGFLVGLWATRR